MKVEIPNTPPEVLPILKRQLEGFGCKVRFLSGTHGIVESIAGELTFDYSGRVLTVSVTKEFGHFSPNLLIGGIKQMVSEAREIVQRGKTQAATA
jgi:hypothetical protein